MRVCDRCGARALWVAYCRAGLLYFCGHHHAKYLAALRRKGIGTALLEDHDRSRYATQP
jgi:hypothetical protein